jgi:release factor glutamine methyltransferase
MKPKTLGDWLQEAALKLSAVSETSRLDVQLITSKVLGISRTGLLAHPEMQLDASEMSQLVQSLGHLLDGEALPYVLGEWEFYGHRFILTPDVLIPRPETEMLVELAIKYLLQTPGDPFIADIGTGSGCIGLSILIDVKNAKLLAVDISSRALAVTRRNAAHYQLERRILCVQSDLLKPISGCFDLICANLPYIPTGRLKDLEVSKREPLLALDGGSDGLQLINILLKQAQYRLKPGGILLLEVDQFHAEKAKRVAENFFSGRISILKDLWGKPRVLSVESATS